MFSMFEIHETISQKYSENSQVSSQFTRLILKNVVTKKNFFALEGVMKGSKDRNKKVQKIVTRRVQKIVTRRDQKIVTRRFKKS